MARFDVHRTVPMPQVTLDEGIHELRSIGILCVCLPGGDLDRCAAIVEEFGGRSETRGGLLIGYFGLYDTDPHAAPSIDRSTLDGVSGCARAVLTRLGVDGVTCGDVSGFARLTDAVPTAPVPVEAVSPVSRCAAGTPMTAVTQTTHRYSVREGIAPPGAAMPSCAITSGVVMHVVLTALDGERVSWVAGDIVGVCEDRARRALPGTITTF